MVQVEGSDGGAATGSQPLDLITMELEVLRPSLADGMEQGHGISGGWVNCHSFACLMEVATGAG